MGIETRRLTLLVLSGLLAASRVSTADRLDVGIFGGVTHTNLKPSSEVLFAPRTFAVFGARVEKGLSDRLSLLVELTEQPRGTIFSHRSSVPVSVDFLELPILLEVSLTRRSTVQPYVFLGPSLGVRVKGDRAVFHDFVFPYETLIIDPAALRRMDAGAAFGAGLAVRLGRRRVFVEIQQQLGLVDLDPREEEVFRTRGLVVRAGLSWRVCRD